MGMDKNMMSMGAKPQGLFGRLAGLLMNNAHRPVHALAAGRLDIKKDAVILDVGCGGGKAVKRMSGMAPDGFVCGIDHAPAMADMARKLNKNAVAGKKAEIKNASVDALPYNDETFDIATAFETIQFWPDIKAGLGEIGRVLKRDGRLLIVNRFPPPDSKWCALLQLKSRDDYVKVLSEAGFRNVKIDTDSKTGWIIAEAQK